MIQREVKQACKCGETCRGEITENRQFAFAKLSPSSSAKSPKTALKSLTSCYYCYIMTKLMQLIHIHELEAILHTVND